MDYKNYTDMHNALVVNKMPFKEIASLCGINICTVIEWKRKLRIKTASTSELVREAWHKYENVGTISSIIGIDGTTVRYHLRKLGIHFQRDINLTEGKVLELHGLGKSNSEIAKIMGAQLPNVSRMIKRLGLNANGAPLAQMKELPNDAIGEYRNGDSLRSISKKYGTSPQHVKSWLIRNGFDEKDIRNSRRQLTKYDPGNILLMFEDGMDRFEIARQLSAHSGTIYRILINQGIRFSVDCPDELNDETWLRKEYSKYGVPTIAKKLNCTTGMVYRALQKFNVMILSCSRDRGSKYVLLNDANKLASEYATKSIETIAKEIGCGHMGTVAYFLRKHGIKIRDMEERMLLMQQTTIERCGLLKVGFARSNIVKKYYGKIGSEIALDSDIESELADRLENDPNVIRFRRGKRHEHIDCIGIRNTYSPDFEVEYNDHHVEVYECKPVNRILSEMSPWDKIRVKMFQQAKLGMVMFGDHYHIGRFGHLCDSGQVLSHMTDDDFYYADNYALWFRCSKELYEFMMKVGWNGHRSSELQMKSLLMDFWGRRIKLLNDVVDNNHAPFGILSLAYNFHGENLYRSRYKSYPTVVEAFTQRHDILRSACDKLYHSDRRFRLQLRSLISCIGNSGAVVPGQFKPDIAASVYASYARPHCTVVDPCAGWGGRMLGAIKTGMNYVGYDINQRVIDGNQQMLDFMQCDGIELKCHDSRTEWPINHFDFVFTSPPYDDTEMYYGYPDNYMPNTAEVVNNIFNESAEKLSVDGLVVLNVPDWFRDKCINIAGNYGFQLKKEHCLKISQMVVIGDKNEPILVFSK